MNQNWTREQLSLENHPEYESGADVIYIKADAKELAIVYCTEGHNKGVAERILACLQALASIPDPPGFVARAKKMEKLLSGLEFCIEEGGFYFCPVCNRKGWHDKDCELQQALSEGK